MSEVTVSAVGSLPSFEQAHDLADAGELKHMLLVSFYFHLGVGTPVDDAASGRWFEKACVSENAEYLCHLGELRERGEMVKQNFVAANLLYLEALKLDEAKGSYMLARLALNQDPSNPYKNLHTAIGYLRRATRERHVVSQIMLLRMHFGAGWRYALPALLQTPAVIIATLRATFGRRPNELWRYADVFRKTRTIKKYVGEDRSFLAPASLQGVVLDRLAPPNRNAG